MPAITYSYAPSKLFAGYTPEPTVMPATVLSGQNLAEYSLVEFDAAGKVITSGGVNKPAGILVSAVNASTGTTNNKGQTVPAGIAADTPCTIYKAGNFFASEIFFNATQSSNLLRSRLVDGTMIVLSFQDVGEV